MLISAFTAGVKFDCELVDLGTHTTASGVDFYTINPKGNVPALVLEDGTVLNEGIAVLSYIANQEPGKVSPSDANSKEFYQMLVALSYTASEVHASIGPLFYPLGPEVKEWAKNKFLTKLNYLESTLIANKAFVAGSSFSIADAYLAIVLSWCPYVGIDLTPYPKVKTYYERISTLNNWVDAKAHIDTKPKYTTA